MAATNSLAADVLTVVSTSFLSEHSVSFTPSGGGTSLTATASTSSNSWVFGDPNLNLNPSSDTISDGITSWTAGAGGFLSGSGTRDNGEIGFGSSFFDTLNNPTNRPGTDFLGSIRSRFEMTFSVSEETRLHFLDGTWFHDFTLSTSAGTIAAPHTGSTIVSGSGTATLDFDSFGVRPGDGGIRITSGTYTLIADWTIGPTSWNGWPTTGVGLSMSWAGEASVPGPCAAFGLVGVSMLHRRRR